MLLVALAAIQPAPVRAASPGGGYLAAWGQMTNGLLGAGYPPCCRYRPFPVPAAGLTNVISVAVGEEHAVAARADGTVWAWGANRESVLGFQSSGHVYRPRQVPGLSSIVQVAAGSGDSLALRRDGTVWSWGMDLDGQVRAPAMIPGLTAVRQIAAAGQYHLAIRPGGTVWAWGRLGVVGAPLLAHPVPVPGLSAVTSVAVGAPYALALTAAGRVFIWGATRVGCLACPAREISQRPVLLRGSGGQPLAGISAIGAGPTSAIAARTDGTVLAWGVLPFIPLVRQRFPTPVPGIHDAVAVAAGLGTEYVVHRDGRVSAWGINRVGELGSGSRRATSCLCAHTPVPVVGLKDATSVVAGDLVAFAITRTPVPRRPLPAARVCVRSVAQPADGAVVLRGAALQTLSVDPADGRLFLLAGGGFDSETGDPVCASGLITAGTRDAHIIRTARLAGGMTITGSRTLGVDERNHRVVALDFGDQIPPVHEGAIRIFDTAGTPIGPPIPFQRPLWVSVDSAAGRAYIVGILRPRQSSMIHILDLHTNRFVGTLPLSPAEIIPDDRTQHVFVVSGKLLITLNAATGQIVTKTTLPLKPNAAVLDASTGLLFLSADTQNEPDGTLLPSTVMVVDAGSGALVEGAGSAGQSVNVGTIVVDDPAGIVLSASDKGASLFSARTGASLGSVTLPVGPITPPVAVDPATGSIIASSQGTLFELDPHTWRIIRQIPTSRSGLAALDIDPLSGWAYALELQTGYNDVRLMCLHPPCG